MVPWHFSLLGSYGAPGRPVGGAPLLASGLPSLSRSQGVPSVPGVAGSGLAFRLILAWLWLGFGCFSGSIWLDLAWLGSGSISQGFCLDLGWIFTLSLAFARIFVGVEAF